ncbi:MAG TPA: thioredoxin domain-containing protein, partial [Actinomycetota bacterium]|nr:thioredoxin domain-containing protein [Actinomycetota bacterium]
MADLVDITDDNFMAEIMDSKLPVLVDCWATWCGPCKLLTPELELLAAEQEGRLKVVKLDVDENPGLSQLLGVSVMPTMVLFVDGIVETSVVGYRPRDYILEQLKPYLKTP